MSQPVSDDLGRTNRPTLVDIAWQIVFRLGFPVARVWWRLRRVRHEGALAAIHVGQSLLLLRSSYRSAWNFPGGSVRQGETPEVSVRRELAEEIGLVADAPLQLVGEVRGVWEGRIDRVFLFALRVDRLPRLQLDNREIIDARLVPIDDLHKVRLTGPVQAYVLGLPRRRTGDGLSTGAGSRRRRNEDFRSIAYICPMNRPLPLIAGLLGVLILAGAAIYRFPPAGLAGFHPRRAIVSLIIALVLFAFAWFQSRRRGSGV